MKLGLIFTLHVLLENFKNMTHVYTSFLHWIRGHPYTRRMILRPISAARPRIDLCTKNPPRSGANSEHWKSTPKIILKQIFRLTDRANLFEFEAALNQIKVVTFFSPNQQGTKQEIRSSTVLKDWKSWTNILYIQWCLDIKIIPTDHERS